MMAVFTTDFYYAGIANSILTRISKMPAMRGQDQDLRLKISLNIAQYFEDIVGDLGIWASFTAKHQELYGKPLPFYEIDVEDYYPDELHEEDIKSACHHGTILPSSIRATKIIKTVSTDILRRISIIKW